MSIIPSVMNIINNFKQNGMKTTALTNHFLKDWAGHFLKDWAGHFLKDRTISLM